MELHYNQFSIEFELQWKIIREMGPCNLIICKANFALNLNRKQNVISEMMIFYCHILLWDLKMLHDFKAFYWPF